MRFAGWYSVTVGLLMLVQWAFFLTTGGVPEFQTEPFRIAFHLVGEGATALGLIVSGVALLRRLRLGRAAALVSLGMLLYTLIVSPGYFAQQGQWSFVAMFSVMLALAVFGVIQLARSKMR